MSDNLPSRASGETENVIPQNTDVIEQQKRLEKLGINISSDILERIQSDRETKLAFERDMSAIEGNPAEKDKFEQLYLKGFWQVVNTPFGELSFAQIQKHPKKEEILAGLKTSKQGAYNEWEEQVAITRVNTEKAWEQVAIKEGDIVAERKQVVISDIIQRVPQIIPVYEMKTARWEKLTREEGETLQYILSLWEPKDWLPRIQKLLSNPQNFA